MTTLENLSRLFDEKFADTMTSCKIAHHEITLEIPAEKMCLVSENLRDDPDLQFDTLIDVCGVDYLTYGVCDWETNNATATGFDRGVESAAQENLSTWSKPRYAVVYHLLSTALNHRLRVRVFATGTVPTVDSVIAVWQSANWFEREVWDMFGIRFKGHPNLKRILNVDEMDIYPLRKEYPLEDQSREDKEDKLFGR